MTILRTSLRPARHAPEAAARWSISYLDMVTILLVLFVGIAAKSAAPGKWVEPAPAQRLATHKQTSDLARLKQAFEKLGLKPTMDRRGLVISMPQAVLFAPGDDQLDARAKQSVRNVAEILRGVSNPIRLIGYTDAVPIHNQRFRDNWELAAARSLRMLDILVGEYGIAESRLSVSSFGANAPKDPGSSAEARAVNRRVEIVVMEESVPQP